MIWKLLMKTTKIKMTMSTQFYKHQLSSDLFKYKIKNYFLERLWIWFTPGIKSLSFPYCKLVEPEQTYFFAHKALWVTKIWTIAWYHKHSHNAVTYLCISQTRETCSERNESHIIPHRFSDHSTLYKANFSLSFHQNFDKKAKMKLNYILIGSIAAMKSPTLITATGKTLTLNWFSSNHFRCDWCSTRGMPPSSVWGRPKTVNDKRLA